jgi:pyruvate/2-oxoglutarate dehydrogenase complex dihydrolipoamide acyltransferase (E2) component
MAEVFLPKIGFTMIEGTLSARHVQDGARVDKGQPLFSFESDKSVQDVEAAESGTLKIIGSAGETYPVGAVIARIE